MHCLALPHISHKNLNLGQSWSISRPRIAGHSVSAVTCLLQLPSNWETYPGFLVLWPTAMEEHTPVTGKTLPALSSWTMPCANFKLQVNAIMKANCVIVVLYSVWMEGGLLGLDFIHSLGAHTSHSLLWTQKPLICCCCAQSNWENEPGVTWSCMHSFGIPLHGQLHSMMSQLSHVAPGLCQHSLGCRTLVCRRLIEPISTPAHALDPHRPPPMHWPASREALLLRDENI